MLGALLVPVVLGVALGALLGHPILLSSLGVVVGLLASTSVFSRRATRANYAEAADTPGVAAAVVDRMRGTWIVTPAVQFNRAQDLVHRVVGRPGVVLLVEARSRGAKDLVAAESRRVRRVVGDTPVHEVLVGDGPGEVALGKLQMHLQKLPRSVKPADAAALDRKLKALTAAGPPLPKGPLPTRIPRGRVR